MPQFYIGFTKLSEFIAALDHGREVYLAPYSLVKPGDHISTCTASLIASQVKDNHLIYCKIDFSRWQELYGRPFGQQDIDRAERAPHLQDQMRAFIVARLRDGDPDLELLEGAPSFPADLMLIPGSVEGITYNVDLNAFMEDQHAHDHPESASAIRG